MINKLKTLNVFLCHSSSDKPLVRELYQSLSNEGWIVPWLDEESILPGQNWREEISKAVRNSDVVIVCLSKTSISKEGFVQKEIRDALDIADEKPEGTIFIIPVKLEHCQVPDRLEKWQWVDYSSPKGYERILRSLDIRLKSLITQSNLAENKKNLLKDNYRPIVKNVVPKNLYENKSNKVLKKETTSKITYFQTKTQNWLFWVSIGLAVLGLLSELGLFTLIPVAAFWLLFFGNSLLIYSVFQTKTQSGLFWISAALGVLGLLAELGTLSILPIAAFWLLFIGFVLLVLALLVKGL